MFHVAISQLTTSRWDLPEEIARLADHGFDCLSLWRAKLSDIGPAAAASLLTGAGMRVSSLQWAGGFTGGDGRTFAESIEDAAEAIETAASQRCLGKDGDAAERLRNFLAKKKSPPPAAHP